MGGLQEQSDMYKPRLERRLITVTRTGVGCIWGGGCTRRVPISRYDRYAKHENNAIMNAEGNGKEKKRKLSQTECRRSPNFSRG